MGTFRDTWGYMGIHGDIWGYIEFRVLGTPVVPFFPVYFGARV